MPEENKDKDRLSLKWGTLKSWGFYSGKARKLLDKYFNIGSSANGAMAQNDTPNNMTKTFCDRCEKEIKKDKVLLEVEKAFSREYCTRIKCIDQKEIIQSIKNSKNYIILTYDKTFFNGMKTHKQKQLCQPCFTALELFLSNK